MDVQKIYIDAQNNLGRQPYFQEHVSRILDTPRPLDDKTVL